MKRNPIEWTPEQDVLLAKLWMQKGSVKKHLHLFGDHSYPAVVAHAKRALNLGPRPFPARGAVGYAKDWVIDELKKAPGTAPELIRRTGLSMAQVCKIVGKESTGTRRAIHILAWRKKSNGGEPVAVYAIGNAPNAVKPEPYTNTEKARMIRARARIKSGAINPFAAAAGLITPRDVGIGRVFAQPMTIREDEEVTA